MTNKAKNKYEDITNKIKDDIEIIENQFKCIELIFIKKKKSNSKIIKIKEIKNYKKRRNRER